MESCSLPNTGGWSYVEANVGHGQRWRNFREVKDRLLEMLQICMAA